MYSQRACGTAVRRASLVHSRQDFSCGEVDESHVRRSSDVLASEQKVEGGAARPLGGGTRTVILGHFDHDQ